MGKSLKIIGVGTRRFHQLTLEGLEALKKSNRVLFLEIDEPSADAFFKEHGISNFESLSARYKDGAIDLNNYRNIASHVLSMVDTHDHVALLVSGHPRLGVYLTSVLEKESKGRCTFDVLEGISSFAAMTNMLQRDPLEKGTAIVDANRLLLFDYSLESKIDTYVYHVCSVANPRTDYVDPSRHNRLDLLQTSLLKWHSPDHLVAFVSAAIDENSRGRMEWFPLGDLKEKAKKAAFSVTLFIPGLKPTQIQKPVLEIMQARMRDSQ